MNSENKKRSFFTRIINSLIWILTIYLLFQIVYGGQFSFRNLHLSKKAYKLAKNRNKSQEEQNELIAKENYQLDHDLEIKRKKSAEIGYIGKGDKVIRKIQERKK